jgi:triphosphoribosyl-dephospho-CoA synthase
MKTSRLDKAKTIAQCLELAILLETSAHKPGNVNVVTDFENTRYEHFLASAVAVAPSLEYGARRGIAVSEGEIDVAEVGVGEIIKNCATETAAWQHGGNTLLGTIILLSPVAVAAGMSTWNECLDPSELRRNLNVVTSSTTPKDAVDVYDAIEIVRPGGLGKAPDLDVNDPVSKNRILEERVSLYEVFKIAEPYDTICSEYVNNYHVTFDLGYPFLSKHLDETSDTGSATIQAFLEVLARLPDTFIARKTNIQKAREVSLRAKEVVELGGVETSAGRKALSKFDKELRKQSNLMNPGTTADIIAVALAVKVLAGYRP